VRAKSSRNAGPTRECPMTKVSSARAKVNCWVAFIKIWGVDEGVPTCLPNSGWLLEVQL
jgi:hypothetical protein